MRDSAHTAAAASVDAAGAPGVADGADRSTYVSRPVWRKALFGASGSPTFGAAPASEE